MSEKYDTKKFDEGIEMRKRVATLLSGMVEKDKEIQALREQLADRQEQLQLVRSPDDALDQLQSLLISAEQLDSSKSAEIAQLANQISELEDAIAHDKVFLGGY